MSNWTEWKIVLKAMCDAACEEYPDTAEMATLFGKGLTPKQALDHIINERCGLED